MQQESQARSDANRSAQRSAVDAFGGARDSMGRPQHPHVDAVRAEMTALLQTGAARSLEDAYERAVWANPATRRTLAAEAEDQRARAAARRADRARKTAAANVPRGGPGGAKAERGRTIEETMAMAYDRLHGAAD